MSVYLKMIAGVLTAVILWICANKDNKGISVLLSLAVCSGILMAGLSFLQPIIEFVYNIQVIGNINNELLEIMLKVIGIGLLTEFTSVICKDAGNEAMGKSIQIMSVILIIRIWSIISFCKNQLNIDQIAFSF